MATTPMDEPNEMRRGEKPVLNALHDAWLATLGLAVVTGEQTGRLLGLLVKKGKEAEPAVLTRGKRVGQTVESGVKEFAEAVGRGTGRAEAALDEKVASALKRMGFPTKDEVRELNARIEALTVRLEELQRASGQGPAAV